MTRVPIAVLAWLLAVGAILGTARTFAQPPGSCGDVATRISLVQGSGPQSPLLGSRVRIEANVVLDARASGLSGFFLEEAPWDHDADPATSEGLFVYDARVVPALPAGTRVRVEGLVTEWRGLTELSEISEPLVCAGGAEVPPAPLQLPADAARLEAHEGMLVELVQPLAVSGNFELLRSGLLTLSAAGRLYQPTQLALPGAAAAELLEANQRRTLLLDDASRTSNPSPCPYLDLEGTRRVGDRVFDLAGVLDGREGGYRIQPTRAPRFERVLPRVSAPAPRAGRLRVVSFNLQNYFTTLDRGQPVCGPTHGASCRGARTESEFQRQRAKLLSVLRALDADILGLVELEQGSGDAARDLLDGLNAELPAARYRQIESGPLGSDVIGVAYFYRQDCVGPVGAAAVLDARRDPRFLDTKHRPVLAQTFVELATQERFTVLLAHLKSRGSPCDDVGDPDRGDGQGECNGTRTDAARALGDFIASDPTHSGDRDVLLMGDLNAYAREAPLAVLESTGLRDQIDRFVGPHAHSYQYDAQSGYLDHALASPPMAAQIVAVGHWSVDADEPAPLQSAPAVQQSTGDPFRASDHDPLWVDLTLRSTALVFWRLPWTGVNERVERWLHPPPE